ncbi:hypothetical protein [Pseudonocardia spinosispora]|uniref:hypothetical protein n=1 Tax=Pseudonocardia spinosispora TaxID=103441 RepID=UPI000491591C|nr:hypothetical protein [Pseudonocardia spinosispora]
MTSHAPSLDGRRFAATDVDAHGEVGLDTTFEYREKDGEIWGSYSGGSVRRGFLVGTRTGDQLDFRYSQLNIDGETSSGHCRSRIDVLTDGRVRLTETWEWESRTGSGTSAVEEFRS